ncbi:MAG: hypothetical protein HYV03_07310 [Deltaproteobacteria bacterium]|nr:hypothetical protein [Deltaproteobacteria bacterium]
MKEIYETREAIMAYLNPGRTIWLLHDQFPNERREYAAKAWGGVGTSIAETAIGNALTLVALPPTAVADDPLVRPVLAAKISQLTALSSGSDTRARWSQYTLEQIGKYLADLHTILGK